MSDLAGMAAEPVEVKHKGVTYKISPMSLGDWAKLNRWAQARWFEDMKQRLELLDGQEKAMLQKRILTIKHKELRIEAAEYMSDADASEYQLWLQLLHEHPELDKETASNIVTFDQFIEMNRTLEPEEEGNAEDPPAES